MQGWTPRTLSHSSVELFARCPAAWKRRYIDRVPEPPSRPMLFGRAMAMALEALHRGQDAELVWLKAYATEVAPFGGGAGVYSVQTGLALLDAYQTYGVGSGIPEWGWKLHLPDRERVPVPIVGYADLVTEEDIWEFKCSAALWDQGRADTSLQATLYWWAFWQLRQQKPRQVRFIILNPRTRQLKELITYPCDRSIERFQDEAAVVWRGIRRGEYPPRCGRCAACGPDAAQTTKQTLTLQVTP